ncbi:MAG TPA: hypothetical protein VEQ60_09355 [Longimicrobium sp.]|nr:hypothetical protein [Longimicrobium sp.]
MAERVIVLIEDDWELLGNGVGDVAHLQYQPALFLMRVADRLGMKVTFMAETLQQLAMRARAADGDRGLAAQAELWEHSVRLFVDRGHDVQLHLHPQWDGAEYRDGFFRLGRQWNLAAHPAPARRRMIAESIACLTELLRPQRPDFAIHAFKAGSWGLQPSAGVLEDLEAAGVRVVMGVGRGIRYQTADFHADYDGLEEDTLPYHPDYEDIRRVSAVPRPLVVLPLPHYVLGAGGFARKARRRLLDARRGPAGGRFAYLGPIPADVAGLAPMGPARGSRGGLMQFRDTRTLDIAAGTFEEMRVGLDQAMDRCLRADAPVVPLVLQSHTKGYEGNWADLERFFAYLVERYGRVIEFRTLSELQAVLPSLRVRGGGGAARPA